MAGTSLERPPLLKDHLRLVPNGGLSKGVLLYMYTKSLIYNINTIRELYY